MEPRIYKVLTLFGSNLNAKALDYKFKGLFGHLPEIAIPPHQGAQKGVFELLRSPLVVEAEWVRSYLFACLGDRSYIDQRSVHIKDNCPNS